MDPDVTSKDPHSTQLGPLSKIPANSSTYPSQPHAINSHQPRGKGDVLLVVSDQGSKLAVDVDSDLPGNNQGPSKKISVESDSQEGRWSSDNGRNLSSGPGPGVNDDPAEADGQINKSPVPGGPLIAAVKIDGTIDSAAHDETNIDVETELMWRHQSKKRGNKNLTDGTKINQSFNGQTFHSGSAKAETPARATRPYTTKQKSKYSAKTDNSPRYAAGASDGKAQAERDSGTYSSRDENQASKPNAAMSGASQATASAPPQLPPLANNLHIAHALARDFDGRQLMNPFTSQFNSGVYMPYTDLFGHVVAPSSSSTAMSSSSSSQQSASTASGANDSGSFTLGNYSAMSMSPQHLNSTKLGQRYQPSSTGNFIAPQNRPTESPVSVAHNQINQYGQIVGSVVNSLATAQASEQTSQGGQYNSLNQMNQMTQVNQMNQMNQLNQLSQLSQLNQMNQLNQMSQMNQMNQLGQLNQMGQVNPINQMSQLNPMGQVSQVNQVNQMNQMNHMNQINTMNQTNLVNPMNQYNQLTQMNQINQMNSLNMNQLAQIAHLSQIGPGQVHPSLPVNVSLPANQAQSTSGHMQQLGAANGDSASNAMLTTGPSQAGALSAYASHPHYQGAPAPPSMNPGLTHVRDNTAPGIVNNSGNIIHNTGRKPGGRTAPEGVSEKRPYQCSYPGCGWSFARSSDLRRHVRSHEQPILRCPFWEIDSNCHRNGGAFNRLDVLKRHLKLVHFVRQQDQGWCRVCGKTFESTKKFLDHCNDCANSYKMNAAAAVAAASGIPPHHPI